MSRPAPAAKSPRLQRRLFLERAWQQFLEGAEPRGVREEIVRSWHRAREEHRVDPRLRQPTLSIAPDALEQRRARDEGLRLAGPILEDVARRVKLRDHVLAWFDGDGWMLALVGDGNVAESLGDIGYRPGASWCEASAATNGAGTALATGKAVEVFAAEHYVAAWHGWSSAAVPVRAPACAEPAGIVAMMGPWECRRRQATAFVQALARGIEERLRGVVTVRDEVVRYAFRAARANGEALVAVDGRGRVIAANAVAAQWNVLRGGVLDPAAQEAVVKALWNPVNRIEAEVQLDGAGGTAVVSPVRYEGLRIGGILRLRGASGRARRGPEGAAAVRYDFGCILGGSPSIRRAVELAETAARTDLPVVLTGESGTGKELFAQAIHGAGPRRHGRFVAVNCGSIPAELLEAELFGYEPGTFTGGRREGNAGRFEEADGGTLFLDELTELAHAAQTALLRVLQENEVVRLGGSEPRPVDVRIVAATNRPLEEEVRGGRFRSDLYYRLNVLRIAVPPLRERGDDVALLARAFVADGEGDGRRSLAPEALDVLRAHSWPGNVRELRNVLLRALALARGPEITAADLVIPADPSGAPGPDPAAPEASPEIDRSQLVSALDTCAWNYRRTARRLGISRMTLYRWLRKHGIERSPARSQGGPAPA